MPIPQTFAGRIEDPWPVMALPAADPAGLHLAIGQQGGRDDCQDRSSDRGPRTVRGEFLDVVTNFFNSDMSSQDAVKQLAEAVKRAKSM